MELTWQMYALVCPLVLLAGFVDSVAGGGGLISLPAYYLAGLPPVMAAGTNKLSACLGTMVSSGRYLKGGKMRLRVAVPAAVAALPGSWLGTNVLKLIPEKNIRIMMLVAIPLVAAVVLGRKDMRRLVTLPERAELPASLLIGLMIGFYDGLVGPGTGTFLILMFTLILGMDPVQASASAKLVNLASNIASLTNLLLAGRVVLALGLPAAACGIVGNYLGAGMTMKRGTGFIRRMMLIVLILLLAKMLVDVVQ